MEARSGRKSIVLSPAEHAPCLIGYDLTYFDQLQAELRERFVGDFGPGRSATARTMFGMSDVVKYEENGRIIMPPILRELGELQSQSLFLGAGEYFELWNPELLLEQENIDPRMARAVKALMAQKGGQ